MASLEEIKAARLAKLELLKSKGINPYPSKTPRDFPISKLKGEFDTYKEKAEEVSVAGRVMAIRGQGAILFAVLFDGTEKIQAIIKKDVLSEDLFSLFTDTVDVGDFISVTGKPIVSERGEQSIMTESWTMAGKTLLPLPEKWHGLQDVEERYRKRYLDFLMNPELRELLVKKSRFWDATRNFLKNEGFLEVETPTLETTTGGAEAEPFATHHNDFDIPVFLRISVGELWQKRLIAGGFPRTFEIGRVYRNEGSSPDHTQEFTNMEFYASFMDYIEGITFTEKLIQSVVQETFGTLDFNSRGNEFSLEGTWPKISYFEIIKEKTGIDVLTATTEEMENKLRELNVKYDGTNKERLTDTLWKYCRKQIVGPAWLVDVPKLVSPLAKAKPENPNLTERVQLILAGAEVTNGFSELNDPIDQKERFELQQKLIDSGDKEAMMPDMEFVEMLEHGMPPTFGFAYGDRLFAILADKPLRELQAFPLMRPFDAEKKKDRETYSAIAIINTEAKLAPWQVMNTVAHLAASFGARSKKNLFKFDSIKTQDQREIKLNIQHAIMIKQADSSDTIRRISELAENQNLEVSHFTQEMLETTNDRKVSEETKSKNYEDINFLGLFIFGPKSQVDNITKDLEFLS